VGSPFPELTTSKNGLACASGSNRSPNCACQELAEATDYAVQIRYDLEI
jgi:hypothetical protein